MGLNSTVKRVKAFLLGLFDFDVRTKNVLVIIGFTYLLIPPFVGVKLLLGCRF